MEFFVVALLSFLFGFAVGGAVKGLTQAMAFYEIMKKLGVTEQQLRDLAEKEGIEPQAESRDRSTDRPVIEVRLEQHNGQIYAYRRDNSQFLGQGTDRDTLIQHLDQTFARGARLIVREDEGAALL